MMEHRFRLTNRRYRPLGLGIAMLFLMIALAGCGAALGSADAEAQEKDAEGIAAVDTDVPAKDTPRGEPAIETVEPTKAPTPSPTVAASPPTATPSDGRSAQLRATTARWNTDWTKTNIDLSEILSGGPPRDGIPSIDDPKFISIDEAEEWLAGNEPVIALEIDADARAYPLQILTWHEVVNDTVGGVPVVVTFCPLCNSAIVFDRRVGDEVYEFGTSGLLRNSDLIMYDRTTESLWQQLTGEGIVGEETGTMLTFLSASLVSFDDFQEAYTDGVVLSRETGISRAYGRNPYAGYDTVDHTPFLFTGELDGRLLPMERIVAVSIGGIDVAYPYRILYEVGAINDTIAGQDVVVLYERGTSSALDTSQIADGQDVGAAGVFDPVLDGEKLTFRKDGDANVDEQTGSTWNVLGQATDGLLAGAQLTPIIHANHFWFAWAAFKPETIIYQPAE